MPNTLITRPAAWTFHTVMSWTELHLHLPANLNFIGIIKITWLKFHFHFNESSCYCKNTFQWNANPPLDDNFSSMFSKFEYDQRTCTVKPKLNKFEHVQGRLGPCRSLVWGQGPVQVPPRVFLQADRQWTLIESLPSSNFVEEDREHLWKWYE